MVRKKFTKKELFVGISGILCIIALLTFYIWHQAETIRLGYKMHELEEEILDLEETIEQLEAQKASLLSLDRVERIAKDRLKMRIPEEDQIIQGEHIEQRKSKIR